MAPTIVAAALEAHAIHQAVCRARRQGLVCSTCTDLAERAERAIRASAQIAEAA
jgi:tRNA G26 N,N-dimethylase Trm1